MAKQYTVTEAPVPAALAGAREAFETARAENYAAYTKALSGAKPSQHRAIYAAWRGRSHSYIDAYEAAKKAAGWNPK